MIKVHTLHPEVPEQFNNVWGDFSFISALNQQLTAYVRQGCWSTIKSEDYIAYMEVN